jgi:large subunit ribosomal protein L15
MQIHELKTEERKSIKRIGRGGCRGTFSGRGMKGQKARSGGNVDPLFQGGRSSLIQQMKKVRGFKSIHPKRCVLTLAILEKNFEDGDKISIDSLLEKKLLRKRFSKNGVKIVANGEVSKKFIIQADILVSAGAKEKIEKTGGKVEIKKVEKE